MLKHFLFVATVIGAPLAWLFPKFRAYVVGPALLLGTVTLIVLARELFVIDRNDRNWSAFMPFFAWPTAITLICAGVSLILSGLRQMRADEERRRTSPRAVAAAKRR